MTTKTNHPRLRDVALNAAARCRRCARRCSQRPDGLALKNEIKTYNYIFLTKNKTKKQEERHHAWSPCLPRFGFFGGGSPSSGTASQLERKTI